MWPNTFKMRKCMQSEECIARSLREQQDNSSSSRPPYELNLAMAVPASIDRFEWQRHGIDGAHHSAGGLGSLGVFLLNLKGEAGVIVMKQGSIQYRAIGLAVPQMRVMAETELGEIVKQLATVRFTSPGAGDALQSGGKQRGAVLMDVEFRISACANVKNKIIINPSISDLGTRFCRGVTLKHPAVGDVIASGGKSSADLLHQLGKLMCADMLVNNFDRTPAIWDHEGNANNLLVDVRADGSVAVWGIDQATAKIVDDAPDGTRVDDYARKVEAAIREAVTGDVDGVATTRVREFIKKHSGHDIGTDGCAALHRGVIEAGVAIAGFHDMALLLDRTSTAFHDAGWGTPGLDSISLSLLERSAEAIANAVSTLH